MTHLLDPESGAARDHALKPTDPRQELRRLTALATEPARGQDEDVPVDLRKYWDILWRRRWTVLVTMVIAMMAGLMVTYNTTPIYRSMVSVQVEEPTFRLTGFQSEVGLGASYTKARRYQKTQEDVLRSRALALRVVDQLGLAVPHRQPTERKPSLLREWKNTLKAWIKGKGADETKTRDRSVMKPADLKSSLAMGIQAGLWVESDKKSQVLRIRYISPDPEKAAAVANAIAENYIAMNMERRFGATLHAEQFLTERIEQVRADLEDSEQRLIKYARKREIVNPDDKLGILMQTLNALNQELTRVETERLKAESQYTQSMKGRGPAAVQIMNNEVIRALKARKGELELEYQGLPGIYKEDYPAKKQLRRQISEIDQQIKIETATVTEAFKADLEAKIREQSSLQARIQEVKSDILDLRDRSTDFQVLKREVDTNQGIYNNLLQRMKEMGVLSGNASNNISIIDRALPPRRPFKPSLSKNLRIALALGLIAGILLAFLFEHLDDTIKTSQEVEERIRAPVLGVIPFVSSKLMASGRGHISLVAAMDPRSPFAEAARSLVTSLSFSTAEGAPKTIHVTSSSAGEGKTTVATNIAIAFARTGGKVLQIDADLRSPSLHHVHQVSNDLGLTNYLAGNTKPADIARPTQVVGLFVVTSGPLPPNPMELLASAKMFDLMSLVAERFDFVIIDGPPVIGLADAIVLSKLARSTIFVTAIGHTRHGTLEGAVKRLHTANANIIGAVVNRFDQAGGRYGYGYGYDYHYTYDYGVRDQTARLPEQA